MNPIHEISLIAYRELTKNLRGVKGLILLALSLVGGTAVALLLVKAFQRKLEGADPEMLRQAQGDLWSEWFRDQDVGQHLSAAPLSLAFMLPLCVWLSPALIWLAGFDGVSGEVQHRCIRYWTVRTRRVSYYVGKFLGLWATITAITFAMHLLMWIVTLSQGLYPAFDVLIWGPRLWLVSVPIVGAWCGLAVLIGSLFRTPITSLLVVGFSFFGIFVLGAFVPWILDGLANGKSPTAPILRGFYPNGYDVYLLSPKIERIAIGLFACLGFAGLPTALGAFILEKKDV